MYYYEAIKMLNITFFWNNLETFRSDWKRKQQSADRRKRIFQETVIDVPIKS